MPNTDLEKLMTRFRLGVFKLNGLLLAETENALDGTGLTRSRNLLLGVLVRAGQPLTIPQICHEMGQTRQGVGRMVSLLVKDGFLELQDNPLHKKSHLVKITPKGEAARKSANERHLELSKALPFPVAEADLETACQVMAAVIEHLETAAEAY
jgi:DNA-binding MarR family transcriptional regulator